MSLVITSPALSEYYEINIGANESIAAFTATTAMAVVAFPFLWVMLYRMAWYISSIFIPVFMAVITILNYRNEIMEKIQSIAEMYVGLGYVFPTAMGVIMAFQAHLPVWTILKTRTMLTFKQRVFVTSGLIPFFIGLNIYAPVYISYIYRIQNFFFYGSA